MKRPFLSFLLVVVVPAGLAMAVAWTLGQDAWSEVQRDSHAQVARMVLAATAAELRADSSGPADTAQGAAPPPPRAPTTVGRSTGYHVALYLEGSRWTGTEPAVGAARLPPTVAEAVGPGSALPAGEEPARGVYLARAVDGAPPRLVALAVPRRPQGALLATPVLLVMGLLLLFGALTGWIQLARRDVRNRRLALGGVVGPALVPALATLVFFIHVDRSFQEAAHEATVRDLSRGLAAAAAADILDDPTAVRTLTGFHATRVREGRAEASSMPGELAALAALPAPPPSFSSSGGVVTTDGPSAYTALRLDGRAFLVATALLPERRVAALRRTLFVTGAVLAVWWMMAAGGAWLRSWRRPGPPPSAGEPGQSSSG